ncbi:MULTISPECIES: SipW-dependent-type signal peptide-containing protein [Nocardiaceae]|uniref:SipW-dependent-type signal peptide-containing protein n=1 Tax=Nocardiaceae TaxID=85025 RepID=UPI0005671437|nr:MULTISPECIES: SipW-dependent-type signal peptide-containing protein [Rhodococcus]OZE99353.1 hypothetical protein CH301_14415 [Rhodococcus sp. 15-1189-1-1a]OZF13646.1 hypothetical protein CH299_14195 [Rhodococcus sp. 14-2686-1-2]
MTDQVQKSNRKRKVRALLAGGLVLGVGAAVTLAAWSDNVFGNSDFATGDARWELQGNFETTTPLTEAGWGDYDITPGGGIAFPIPLKNNLTPGDVVRAPVAIRLAPGQELGASVTLDAPNLDAGNLLQNALTYGIYSGVTAADCVAGNVGAATLVPVGSPLSTGGTFTIASGAAAENGTPVELCYVVTLPSGTPSNVSGLQTGTLVWDFQGTSIA